MAIYSRGKRAKKTKLSKGKIFTIVLILIILACLGFIIYVHIVESQIGTGSTDANEIEEVNIIQNVVEQNVIEEKKDEIVDKDIPSSLDGYDVVGQIVMDKYDATRNILSICTEDSLNVSPTQLLMNPSINEPGNFCIIGHNWDDLFQYLSEMERGDTFYLISRKAKTKVKYKIKEVYVCEPDDLSCLEQNNDGKREVTLITCVIGGAKRIIARAYEA